MINYSILQTKPEYESIFLVIFVFISHLVTVHEILKYYWLGSTVISLYLFIHACTFAQEKLWALDMDKPVYVYRYVT